MRLDAENGGENRGAYLMTLKEGLPHTKYLETVQFFSDVKI